MAVETPAPIRPASTILLLRNEPAFQVLMVHRSSATKFVPGALIFPGGKIDESDHASAWEQCSLGWDMVSSTERALRIAAAREIFEETGLLLARDANGHSASTNGQTHALRQKIESGARSFLDLLKGHGLKINLADFALFSRWRTPAVSPKRFDTSFYLAMAPDDQHAISDGRETVKIEWISPREALKFAKNGERDILLPTLMNLKSLAEFDSAEQALNAVQTKQISTIEARLEQQPAGSFLVLDPEAGYGRVVATLQGRLVSDANVAPRAK